MKIKYLLIALVLLTGLNLVSAWNTNLMDGLTSQNMSLTAGVSSIKFLSIPQLNVPITYASFNITGFGSSSSFSCYQKQPDSYTAGDGSCNLNYGGTYTWNSYGFRMLDNNLATEISTQSGPNTIEAYYYLPNANLNNVTLNLLNLVNITLPSYCYAGRADVDVRITNLNTNLYDNPSLPGINNAFLVWCYDNQSVKHGVTAVYDPSDIVLYIKELAITWNVNTGGGSPSDVVVSVTPNVNIFSQSGSFTSTAKISNFVTALNNYLSTCTYSLGYCSVPIYFYSSQSGILQYSDVNVTNGNGYTYNSETYTTPVLAGSSQTFTLNITYDAGYYYTSQVYLSYNGTKYSPTPSSDGTNSIFTRTITIPNYGSNAASVPFFWNVTLVSQNSVDSFPTSLVYQTVNPVSQNNTSSNCYIQFNLKNFEYPHALINGYFTGSFNLGANGNNNTITINDLSGANSSFYLCPSPSNINYTLNGIVQYGATGYSNNYYYFNNATISNQTQVINLSLINSSKSTLTELSVLDASQRPVEGVYINIEAYDIGTDTYSTVAMAKSNFNGKDIVYLNWGDVLYKFILIQNGTIVKTTTPTKIYSTPQTFYITPADAFPYDKFNQVSYTVYFNNLTNNFVATYTDPTGLVASSCLKVTKLTTSNDTEICDTCSTSSSATLYCNIAAYGNGTYVGEFYGTGSFCPYQSIQIVIGMSNDIYGALTNEDASFYALIFAGIVVAMFMLTPALGVIGALLGMIGAVVVGFQPIDFTIYLVICVIGGVIVWILKR